MAKQKINILSKDIKKDNVKEIPVTLFDVYKQNQEILQLLKDIK